MSKTSRKKAKISKIKLGNLLKQRNPELKYQLKLNEEFYLQSKLAKKKANSNLEISEKNILFYAYYDDFSTNLNLSLTNFKKYNFQSLKSSSLKQQTNFGTRVDILTVITPAIKMENTIFGVLNLVNYKDELERKIPFINNFFKHNRTEKNIGNLITFQFTCRVSKTIRGKETIYHALRPSATIHAKNITDLLTLYNEYLRPFYIEYNYDYLLENIMLRIRHTNYLKIKYETK